MTEYKKQHWLPAAYLQFFSCSGKPEGRKSKVFWADAERCQLSSVGSLCVKKFHYSKIDPKGAETSFHQMEGDYSNIVKKILAAQTPTKAEYFGIIMIALDLHIRNPSYENRTGNENYAAYQELSRSFVEMIFSDAPGNGKDLNEVAQHLEKYWGIQPIRSKEKFITSDHPSLVFSTGEDIAFIFLPIHPLCGVLLFDNRRVRPLGASATNEDVAILNAFQAATSIRHLFADYDMTPEIGEGKPITKWLRKERQKGFIDGSVYKPELLNYPGNIPTNLSFLEIV
ncbi:MAG: DUF4238 domain-containing protein [Gallionella sp.]|nr:DUF4238 domain-containing protein [Gallionella sp.]